MGVLRNAAWGWGLGMSGAGHVGGGGQEYRTGDKIP